MLIKKAKRERAPTAPAHSPSIGSGNVNAQTILQIRLPTGAPAVRRQVVTASDPPNFRETARGDSAPRRLA